MPYDCRQTVAPTAGPVSLVRAKSHLRVTGTDEDPLIADLLAAAVRSAQRECGLQFITATYVLTLDDFPRGFDEVDGHSVIRLPVGPVVAVSSITYKDTAAANQTVSSSDYSVGLKTGRIRPINYWPSTYADGLENVTVTFTAGFGAAADVPMDAVRAVLMILADAYENRGDEGAPAERPIPAAALRLLNNLRNGDQW